MMNEADKEKAGIPAKDSRPDNSKAPEVYQKEAQESISENHGPKPRIGRDTAARRYIGYGWCPIPIAARSKNPGRKDWQKQRYTSDQVPAFFRGEGNIGVILGPSGLVDIDLDCLEAVKLAGSFLPKSAVFGRKSNPDSHWVYKVENPLPHKDFRAKSGKILEYRSGNHQTVFPPSIHVTGEAIKWTTPPPATQTDGRELFESVSRLAAASLMLRHFQEGHRDILITTVTGLLLSSGRKPEEVDYFTEKVARAAGCDFEGKAKYQKQRLENGEHVFGVPKLKEIMGEDDANTFLEFLNIRSGNQGAAPSLPDDPDKWADPVALPDPLPPVLPMTPEMIPDPLREWLVDIAERMQVPLDYPATAAIVGLGSVIGRGCGIHPKRLDDWMVIPNLWGGIVGRPSLKKTPAIAEALFAVKTLEDDARKAHQAAMELYGNDLEQNKVVRSALESDLKKAIKNKNDATERVARERLSLLVLEEPQRRRFQTQDGTTEKIGEISVHNSRGILILRDELLGLFRSMDKEGRESDRAFYLEAWNGSGGYTYDRIGRGTLDIPALCLSIFGAVTPGSISRYVYEASRGGKGDDGFLQRFQLLVYPDSPKRYDYVDRPPNKDARARVLKIFESLAGEIKNATLEKDDPIPSLRFDEEGQAKFDRFVIDLETRLRSDHGLPPAIEAHLGKFGKLVAALALIFRLIELADSGFEDWPVEVTGKNVDVAILWCGYAESHAMRIYQAALQPGLESARELLKHVRRGEIKTGDTVRSVYRGHQWKRLTTAEEVRSGLSVLEEYDWLVVGRKPTGDKGGAPSEIITLNPKISKLP